MELSTNSSVGYVDYLAISHVVGAKLRLRHKRTNVQTPGIEFGAF